MEKQQKTIGIYKPNKTHEQLIARLKEKQVKQQFQQRKERYDSTEYDGMGRS